jgi:aminoglycoside phosphotransferase (APT) family kinase protein
MAEVVGSSRSLGSANTAPGGSLPGDVAERTARVLASFWSLPEATCSIPDGVATPSATTRPASSTILTARVRSHAGRPPAFLKMLRHAANFTSEYQGLVGARAACPPSLRVRVPAVLHTVEAERALLIEYIPGTRATPWMRRRYLVLPDWCLPAVRDLGRWLAAYHESRQYYVSPEEFVAGHLRLARRYIDDAAERLGAAGQANAHRLLDALGRAISAQPVRLTWCHGDLVLNNLIAHERMLYIVDFTRYGVGPPEADLVGLWSSLRREIGPLPFSAAARTRLWSAFVEAYDEASTAGANANVLDLWTLEELTYELAYASHSGQPFSASWLRRTRLASQTASYLRAWLQERARVYSA